LTEKLRNNNEEELQERENGLLRIKEGIQDLQNELESVK